MEGFLYALVYSPAHTDSPIAFLNEKALAGAGSGSGPLSWGILRCWVLRMWARGELLDYILLVPQVPHPVGRNTTKLASL